jgi:hypothetical protein
MTGQPGHRETDCIQPVAGQAEFAPVYPPFDWAASWRRFVASHVGEGVEAHVKSGERYR